MRAKSSKLYFYELLNFVGPFAHFRIGSNSLNYINISCNSKIYNLNLEIKENEICIKLPDGTKEYISLLEKTDGNIRALIKKEVRSFDYFIYENNLSIWTREKGRFDFLIISRDEFTNANPVQNESKSDGRVYCSMPCKINQMLIRPGDSIKIGDPLCVTEAMKMEVSFF